MLWATEAALESATVASQVGLHTSSSTGSESVNDPNSSETLPLSLTVRRAGWRERLGYALASAVSPVAVIASVHLSSKDLSKGPVLCPLRLATGIPCPFCGMTTSFAHMGGGRVRDAFLANPAGPYLFAAVVLAGVLFLATAVTGRMVGVRLGSAKWVPRALEIATVAAVAMMWVAELFRFGIL